MNNRRINIVIKKIPVISRAFDRPPLACRSLPASLSPPPSVLRGVHLHLGGPASPERSAIRVGVQRPLLPRWHFLPGPLLLLAVVVSVVVSGLFRVVFVPVVVPGLLLVVVVPMVVPGLRRVKRVGKEEAIAT